MASGSPGGGNGEGRRRGRCKWFNVAKGWGFITPNDGGQDVFVHQSVIKMSGFRSLGDEEEVEFECQASDKGLEATIVSGLEGLECKGSHRRPISKKRFRKIRCYNCGEFANHIAAKCTMGPQPKRCHQCRAVDHLIADCPLRSTEESKVKNNNKKTTKNGNGGSSEDNNNDDSSNSGSSNDAATSHNGSGGGAEGNGSVGGADGGGGQPPPPSDQFHQSPSSPCSSSPSPGPERKNGRSGGSGDGEADAADATLMVMQRLSINNNNVSTAAAASRDSQELTRDNSQRNASSTKKSTVIIGTGIDPSTKIPPQSSPLPLCHQLSTGISKTTQCKTSSSANGDIH